MSQSYLMVSQPSPSIPPSLPFLSSPDSPNVHTAPNNTSPGHEHRQNYYSSSVNIEDDSKSKSDFDLNALSTPHQPPESAVEHESLHLHVTAKPVLETDGVVSSEVGDVPGILHQDLHPDGQPRRPMNAFMIFARHRRPVVQAKEPGLKTGEISKRLSHDWKNLPEEDKSHYLEQAKLLKDEFHSRFPEYVYKRRPNNTGKRRSSISQQQLHSKFVSAPGTPQPMGLSQGPMNNGCMSHPSDIHPHHYHQHLHPTHGEMYHPGHSHHLHHHSHVQPPSRPLSSLAQHSSKLPSPNFYPTSTNPTSPKYQHVGHSSCTPLAPRHSGPYSSCGPPLTSSNNVVVASALHSPRPGSPVPASSLAANGMSYMRLSNPHTVSYQTQPSSHQYPWFTHDSSYDSPSGHRVGPVQTPLSATRPSFSYSTWPPSVASDSHSMSVCGLNRPEDSDPTQAPNSSRAASYSAGPPIYRPASPIDRARQLSLPSHSLTAQTAETANGLLSDPASSYHDRLHHDHHHSNSAGAQHSSNHNYGAYATSDIMNNSQRSSYSAISTASGFGSNSVRNGLAPGSNGTQSNSGTPAAFEQHHSHNIIQSSNPNSSDSSKNHFTTHCSPLHHPAPPPPPPAAATSHHHHQHSSSNLASVNAVTSIEY